MEKIGIIERQRNCFKEFMKKNKLNTFSWTKKAGISEATLRHFLSGRNNSLTSVNLEKLANAAGVKPEELIGSSENLSPSLDETSLSDKTIIEIDRDLFIQVFIDVEKYLELRKLNLPSHATKANIVLAWYQLTKLLNLTGNISQHFNLLDQLIRKLTANA